MANTETPPDAAREVRGVMGRFGRAFSVVDVDALIELWDPEYPDPIYQPEELEAPLRSWPEVRAYFEALPTQITGVSEIRPLDIRVDVAGDFAYAYVRAWGSLGVVRRGEPIDGEVRQTFVMRRRDGEWRLVHYHESRLTPGLEDAVA